jgi:hypothetical protein
LSRGRPLSAIAIDEAMAPTATRLSRRRVAAGPSDRGHGDRPIDVAVQLDLDQQLGSGRVSPIDVAAPIDLDRRAGQQANQPIDVTVQSDLDRQPRLRTSQPDRYRCTERSRAASWARDKSARSMSLHRAISSGELGNRRVSANELSRYRSIWIGKLGGWSAH